MMTLFLNRMRLAAAIGWSLLIVGVVFSSCASTGSKTGQSADHVSAGTGAPKTDLIQVQVEQGDTLNKIAKQFDTDWKTIVRLNRDALRSGLKVGQVLIITPGPNAEPVLQMADDEDSSHQEDLADDEDDDLKVAPRRKGLLFGGKTEDANPQFIFPVEGRLSSKFGKRGRKFHKGIDLAVNVGTPIVAIAAGEVVFSGKRRGYGGTVVIDHGNYLSLYAHCSKMMARVGDVVKQGDFIAKSGRTGNARGAHLHFEIRDAENRPVDPLPLLKHRLPTKIGNHLKTKPVLVVAL
jgi:murein DD-endopeptidase MepM/ murein hydrolase activator NlpD